MTNPRAFENIDPLEHQAKHHPTDRYSVKDVRDRGEVKNGKVVRTTEDVQRRVTELKIWNDLDPAQTEAAQAIYRGWMVVAGEMQPKSVNLADRVDGGRRKIDPDARIIIREDYQRWLAECHRVKASRSINLCLSVFCFGNNLDEAAALARMSNRKVKPNLVEGLDIYCAVNGMRG